MKTVFILAVILTNIAMARTSLEVTLDGNLLFKQYLRPRASHKLATIFKDQLGRDFTLTRQEQIPEFAKILDELTFKVEYAYIDKICRFEGLYFADEKFVGGVLNPDMAIAFLKDYSIVISMSLTMGMFGPGIVAAAEMERMLNPFFQTRDYVREHRHRQAKKLGEEAIDCLGSTLKPKVNKITVHLDY